MPVEDKTNDIADMNVFPNPFESKIRIQMPDDNYNESILSVYNPQGIKLINVIVPQNSKFYDLDVSSFPKGIYIMRIIQDKNIRVEKLVKY